MNTYDIKFKVWDKTPQDYLNLNVLYISNIVTFIHIKLILMYKKPDS